MIRLTVMETGIEGGRCWAKARADEPLHLHAYLARERDGEVFYVRSVTQEDGVAVVRFEVLRRDLVPGDELVVVDVKPREGRA